MSASTDTKDYYRRRALSYEAIYHRPDPIRLAEQEELAKTIRAFCTGKDVLEVAAGTGWWSVQAASTAQHLTLTDAVAETLAIAQTKPFPPDNVTFQIADAFDLAALGQRFEAIISFFFLSHVSHAERPRFLQSLRAALKPGGTLMLADNVWVPGLGGDLITPPGSADTYKRRTLPDGSEELVLKNYDTRQTLQKLLAPLAINDSFRFEAKQHFWWTTVTTA